MGKERKGGKGNEKLCSRVKKIKLERDYYYVDCLGQSKKALDYISLLTITCSAHSHSS